MLHLSPTSHATITTTFARTATASASAAKSTTPTTTTIMNTTTATTSDTVYVSYVFQNANIKKKIRFMNTNAQSLQFKMNDLKSRIEDKGAKIIGVTETWGQEWKEATLEMEHFNSFRKDRTDGRRGGGCIIYVSNELKSYNCNEL